MGAFVLRISDVGIGMKFHVLCVSETKIGVNVVVSAGRIRRGRASSLSVTEYADEDNDAYQKEYGW